MQKINKSIVILAAGASTRFGSNKLLAEYQGKTLYQHTLQKVSAINGVKKVIVTGTKEIMEAGERLGFSVAYNPCPEEGITRSLQMGILKSLEITEDLNGILFCVCDQPALRKETIKEMLLMAEKKAGSIICAGSAGRRGNPVYFDRIYFQELMDLKGDQGGKQIIKKYPDQVRVFGVTEDQLMDVDSPSDLKNISLNLQ